MSIDLINEMTVKAFTPPIIKQPEDKDLVVSIDNVFKKFCRNLKRSLFYGIQDIAAELTGSQSKVKPCDRKNFGHYIMLVFSYGVEKL